MLRSATLFLLSLLLYSAAYSQGWVWGRGSISNNVAAWAVAKDYAGDVYAAGVASGAVSFDGFSLPFSAPGNLCLLVKYNYLGDFLWARSTQNSAHAGLINIAVDTRGNCFVLGWLNDTSIVIGGDTIYNTVYPAAQYFLARYDGYGNVAWARSAGGHTGSEVAPAIRYSSADSACMRGLGALAADAEGNMYVATCYNLPRVSAGADTLINKDTTGATSDIMLVKYDTSGNVVWAQSTGGKGDDIPFSIAVSPTGSVYIAGMYNSDTITIGTSVLTDTATGPQRWNAFIARYNSTDGSAAWAAGSGGSGRVFASGVATDDNSNVYLTGGMDDSTIFFAGQPITDSYPGKPVLYLASFDAYNNPGWERTIGSPSGGMAWGYGVATATSVSLYPGSVWVVGACTDTISVSGTKLDTPAASTDPLFVAGYDIHGNYVAAGELQSGGAHQAGISCDVNTGAVYICGSDSYPCTSFTVGPDVLPDAAAGEEWMYVAQFDPPGSGGPGPGGGGTTIVLTQSNKLSLCEGDTLALEAPLGQYIAYKWQDGNTDTMRLVITAGTYWVECIGREGYAMVDTFNVTASEGLCSCNAILPDAFTPNYDGHNDTYAPSFQQGCAITHYAFSIYNRWGQRVFYSEDPYARWDGTFAGQPCPLDTYMYYLRYKPDPKYPEHVRKGDVTLIR